MKTSKLLTPVVLALFALSACSDDEPPEDTEPDPCFTSAECDPGYVCNPILGECELGSVDVGTPDTGDTGDDATEDTSEDVVEDTGDDTGDDTVEVDTTEDVTEDADGSGDVVDGDTGVDADVADVVEEDPVQCIGGSCCRVSERNVCGGCETLTLDGEEKLPGEPCGACFGGTATCNGPNALQCVGAADTNVCGTCEVLDAPPATSCGACGNGQLVCSDDAPLGVACEGATNNGCGGCVPIDNRPGTLCRDSESNSGLWSCDGFDAVDCVVGARNLCGGESVLRYRGDVAEPGTPCGPGLSGALGCDGLNTLVCSVTETENACGGVAPLAGAPNSACSLTSACGAVTASWVCSDSPLAAAIGVEPFDGVVCIATGGRPENACGGCTDLENEVGALCNDGAGKWTCDGTETLFCLDAAEACAVGTPNGCGGCTVLEGTPGERCGSCSSGQWTCDARDTLSCVGDLGDGALNACGGCADLEFNGVPAEPSTACGSCGTGTLVCDEEDYLLCEGDLGDSVTNICGGCGTLDGAPGGVCGECDSGTFRCTLDGSAVACVGDIGTEGLNACGGCNEMEGNPGEVCGECDSGVTACLSDASGVQCLGDAGAGAYNACGGCGDLDGTLGAACGECGSGVLACGGDDTLVCEGDLGAASRNACGGCGDLDGELGVSCGTCGDGVTVCASENTVTCEGAVLETNACGGCGTLDGDLGAVCGDCGAGQAVCNGSNDLRCAGAGGKNECGGCGVISVPLDDACGACDSGRYICVPSGAQCWGVQTNACGGCGTLSGAPGTTCSAGGSPGVLSCVSTEAVTCTAGATNACGGTSTLMHLGVAATPGTVCGLQRESALRCAGPNTLECPVPDGANACGGTALLAGAPGATCSRRTGCGSVAGTYACATEALLGAEDAFDGVVCVPTEETYNACGGCTSLRVTPGEVCPEGGVAQCDGLNAIVCLEDASGGCEGPNNECGGCSALAAVPGDACGTCNSGLWSCTGAEEVSCIGDLGADALNSCGGCSALVYNAVPADAGEPCGCGTEVLTCLTAERLTCDRSGETLNACGGCGPLDGAPGDACGTCGTGELSCLSSREGLRCVGDNGPSALNECGGCGPATDNACGGCAVLDGEPGEPCGTCGTGTYTCDGSTAVVCTGDNPGAANACGGCGTLVGNAGDACGTCNTGELACSATGDTYVCQGNQGSSALNECGGCDELIDEVNTPCGTCETGRVTCDGQNATQCINDAGAAAQNACGGCVRLTDDVGAVCGTCDSGTFACDGDDALVCAGDSGPGSLNACGGCFGLPGDPGEACGVCNSGSLVCDGTENTVCVGEGSANACGGCTDLGGEVGAACGVCDSGTFACDGTEALTCSGDAGESARNDCGGCSTLPAVGSGCGVCQSGTYACNGDEAVTCENDGGSGALNDCGGCAELDHAPATVCGACETEVWACDGGDTVVCDTTTNPCPTCDDSLLNQDETDVDCGGGVCGGCEFGEACLINDDCAAGGTCEDGACNLPPACDDGRVNGDETDIDCGGTCAAGCSSGLACVATADCAGTATCVANICTPPPLTNPWIAYTATVGGLPRIFLVRAAGTTPSVLLDVPGDLTQTYPTFSPDGSRLAYLAVVTGSTEIGLRVVELETPGGNPVLISHGLSNLAGLSWSPDGSSLVAEGSGVGGDNDLYIIPLDGSGAYAAPESLGRGEAAPQFVRPNEVWYVAQVSGEYDVWSRTLDTPVTSDVRITTGSDILGGPSVSWDFAWMTHNERLTSTTSRLVRRNLGSGATQSQGTGEASTGVIAPDGMSMAYVDVGHSGFGVSGRRDIFWATVATGGVVRAVTADSANESSLAISPAEAGTLWLEP